MTIPPSSAAIILIAVTIAAVLVDGLGSGATIAVTYGTATVCGIVAGESSRRIQCYRRGQTVTIQPNISYEALAGGRSFFCGLRSGGLSLLCWDATFSNSSFRAKRIYNSDTVRLTGLTVGDSQVCAVHSDTGVVKCWRGDENGGGSSCPSPGVASGFRAITSGRGFSCGILKKNGKVVCWGDSEIGAEIQSQFSKFSMLSLIAGDTHACGLSSEGFLICKGNNSSGQLDVPSDSAFKYSELALGANHTCAVRRRNGLLECWGGGAKKLKFGEFSGNIMENVSFESIVAGLEFTCGLTTRNLSLLCWGPDSPSDLPSGRELPLPMMIPGPCVRASCSACGVYPDSESLCAGSGNICKSCIIERPLAVPLPLPTFPTSPLLPPPPPLAHVLQSSAPHKKRLLMAFAVVGLVGALAGICSVVYCLWTGLFGLLHQKMYSSADPAMAEVNVYNAAPCNGSSITTSKSSPNKQQSSRTTGASGLERSETSSKHWERAEEFSLLELAAATNNFSLVNKIGGGGFGTVYKGRLADGREVAIKRGEPGVRRKKFQNKESAFDSELALLSRLHHKHLLGLVGFCHEIDERLLVYEYMSNGALHDHLHSKKNTENHCSILNSWRMRIKIALDAARGVEYLHNYAVPHIIHRDIKSSNILLDANWTAKVSDFGLSLMGPVPDRGCLSIKAVGTVGYIDPEYYVLNVLTTKSDVYSFGVVLLELLTGKKAVFKNEDGNGPMGVVEYAVPKILAGELQSALDMRVGFPVNSEAKAVELVAYSALHCVNMVGKERPTITDIAYNLERALALCEDCNGSTSNNTFSIPSD